MNTLYARTVFFVKDAERSLRFYGRGTAWLLRELELCQKGADIRVPGQPVQVSS